MSQTDRYRRVCEDAVRAAGALLMEKWGRVAVRHKGPTDLVTEADLAAQEVVRRIVVGAFPDHSLLGEEDAVAPVGRSEYRWIVDPLDGTTNYVHGFPFFSVSLALERNGELLVGAVYNPVAEEYFAAVKGEGARLNGKPIRTSHVEDLAGAVATAGFPYQLTRSSPDLLVFVEAALHCQSMRRTGSAALNLAFVAAGRAEIFWSFSTKVWDIAAGVLLVREAGGTVTAPDGGALDLESGHFVAAANGALHARFLPVVERAIRPGPAAADATRAG